VTNRRPAEPPGHTMTAPAAPVLLAPNTVPSFYPGAGRIATFRGNPNLPAADPEDWIASTTPRTGMAPRGLSHLQDGSVLADRFEADPVGWFGPEHVDRYGSRPALLIKLLDAGQRLPLHVHPDRTFARAHLSSDFGKTEAWLVLDAEPGASVHLGFSRDVSQAELAAWVTGQQTTELLEACNRVPLHVGDVLLCPAGVPHAIGEGVLVVELQEMTDFSIMLEWAGYPIEPDDVFLGLTPELALSNVDRRGITGQDLAALAGTAVRSGTPADTGISSLLPPAADELFKAEQVIPPVGGIELDARFAVLIINTGDGRLTNADSAPVAVSAGQTLLVPYTAGPITLTGDVSALRCYPA
jgi:mannose-6-phosphate isomerase